MDSRPEPPRTRAQTLRDLITQVTSTNVEQRVTVESVYGTATFQVPALPFSDPEPGEPAWKIPPLLSPVERNLLEAAAGSVHTLGGEELCKRAGYPYRGHAKTALSSLRRLGLLGGHPGQPGYPLTDHGRRALAT